MEAMRAEYHLRPPAPYDEKLKLDNLEPTAESVRALREEIEQDLSLSPAQRSVLQHELSDRWRAVVIGQAGEGFND